MISSSRNYLTDKPFVFFIPGSVLVLLTLSVVLIGDGLRDALDPKLDLTFWEPKKKIVRAALSNTFGFGGHNASVILKKYSA
jgi:3-oxoacyl-(acyl-carrier-protein) synthase